MSGVVSVREFRIEDLDASARFCDAARAQDSAVEPFSQRLGVIATGTRAALELWRVAEDEEGALHGIAFAAFREAGVFDFYAAVDPALRRQGLGRALAGPALSSGAVLRARVREDAKAGRAFLSSLGFVETGAQLVLHWNGKGIEQVPMPALRIRAGTAKDQGLLERLSGEAWKGAPDAFASRADEIAQLFGEEGRVVLVAESEGKPMGYVSGVQLGRTLGIEEVAVVPEFRRMGIGRALVAHALAKEQGAVLSVSESNKPARALYKSLGFTQTARRLVFEKR
ncbi:MAG: N-acetyltransferase family protein [Myxococcales bacterium]|nr:GNAT family N-acetyltransferase [Myxococcales bacterium]